MPKYVIEREIPGVGTWPSERRQAASRKSVDVLRDRVTTTIDSTTAEE
jgi:hypothetical protein